MRLETACLEDCWVPLAAGFRCWDRGAWRARPRGLFASGPEV